MTEQEMINKVAKNGGEYSFKTEDGKVEDVHRTDPDKKSLVLHITTTFGKHYTCRTVEELETWIDNFKAEKKLKRDEDVGIQIGFGRMTESEYAQVPACKYFIKPK